MSALSPARALSPASAAMDVLAETTGSVDLATVLDRAALTERVDTKYLIFPAVLGRLIEHLQAEPEGEVDVLEIDGRRRFAYESRYLDTPDLRMFRDHLQGRRRRFKVRTRSYLDTGGSFLELKLAGAVGGTEKVRWALPDRAVEDVAGRAPGALESLYRELAHHGHRRIDTLAPSLTTTYSRTTFVGRNRPFRLTVDTDLECREALRPGRGGGSPGAARPGPPRGEEPDQPRPGPPSPPGPRCTPGRHEQVRRRARPHARPVDPPVGGRGRPSPGRRPRGLASWGPCREARVVGPGHDGRAGGVRTPRRRRRARSSARRRSSSRSP